MTSKSSKTTIIDLLPSTIESISYMFMYSFDLVILGEKGQNKGGKKKKEEEESC